MQRLVLWDIDQTLVSYAGYGRVMYAAALLRTTGHELREMPDLAGRTDREITEAVLAGHGVEADEELIEAFYQEMIATALAGGAEMLARGQALAGAAAALGAVAGVSGVVQSVVTGNLAPVARHKLALFDLAEPIDFEIGGYGSDGPARSMLVRAACERAARKYGAVPATDRVVVIGDTVFDIRGALDAGVVAVGVASGRTTAAELTAAGAHAVLPSLADTSAVLAALGH
ncbi:phosphoglycolate phosphatase-like HAD superfamily hydrolase [Allocatelliglobosispora scoriae]|uniref:Phosphoglycolate phosphatase-like HAD superfamily hydrolase n=1 Tax=Allocatelliglobosispora scoriae TaxID=643052 RepID=A0A841C317_9ACTN|nr:HAD hydrolase-like protein [Allocatelliglobosispora scoriae]MBB5873350.1 phosphoglycolate phosphatase-like HAD superfamily hydrolase [Allocatelliglobosispora scoriae]